MKQAAGPLLLLGACRIHSALGANHRESPCSRGAEGTTQGARPSEEGWDRSQCRCKAQAPWSHPAPLRFHYDSLRFHYGSFTVLLRFLYGLLRPITPLLRLHDYRVPEEKKKQSKNEVEAGGSSSLPARVLGGRLGRGFPLSCARIAVSPAQLVQGFPRRQRSGIQSKNGRPHHDSAIPTGQKSACWMPMISLSWASATSLATHTGGDHADHTG